MFDSRRTIPVFILFHWYLYYFQDFPITFQRSSVGRAHEKSKKYNALFVMQKFKKRWIEFYQMVIL